LRDEASTRGEPLLRGAQGPATATTAAGKALAKFLELIEELTQASKILEPAHLVIRLLERSGYRAMFEEEDSPEAKGRLENLDELVRFAADFEWPEEAATPLDRLQAWLDRITLASKDEEPQEGGEVTLMTVHNSKGLEFPVVFVVHMMEGQFPHHRASESETEVEEERRLAYVAFTRAKSRLLITRAETVVVLPRPDGPPIGSTRPAAPSRFLFGLPESACKGDMPVGVPGSSVAAVKHVMPSEELAKLRTFQRNRQGMSDPVPMDPSRTTIEIEDPESVRAGATVQHPRFGIGVVVARSGVEAVVRFDQRSVPTKVRIDGMRIVVD